MDEVAVPRYIDDSHGRSGRQGEMGEPEVDRDAALFFLRMRVAFDAGKSFDQCGFPVIDMTGRADDEVGHNKEEGG